jgi:hypothetical protein
VALIPGAVRPAIFALKRLEQAAKEIDPDLLLDDIERGREDAEFADVISSSRYLTVRNIQSPRAKWNGYFRTPPKFKGHCAV